MRTLLVLALILVPLSAFADVERRTLNNGNLILEDIPPIPERLVTQLNRYQNVRSAPIRAFSLDGDSVYVSTRFGDVSQIHRVDQPGGARRQLTFFKEPIGGVSRRPGAEDMTFTMDAGGSEFSQIFMLDPKTGNSTMLTDGESRNGAVLWSHGGDRIAYQSTARNGRSNDVWIMDPAKPEAARVVLESPDGSWWGPAAWDSEDKRLLVVQYVAITDVRVHVVDLASGERRQLLGDAEQPSANLPYGFSADGAGVFFSTNQFAEFEQLAYLDLASGEVRILTEDIPWDIESFVLAPSGDRGAFTINEGGLTALYLFDATTMAYSKVDLPVGVVGGLEFDEASRQLGLSINTPNTPSDTFVLGLGDTPLAAGALTRWTFSEVGGLDTEGFAAPELIQFSSFDDREIPAFLYQPEGEGPFPVIISIHGGPEGQYRPYFSSTYQLWLKSLGAAVISPNVRGSSGYGKTYVGLDNGYKREDSVRDIGALLDWIATQPQLDASRVAVIGGSYGGYMVLASAVHYSDRLSAAVDIVGISNFVTFLENTQDYRRDLRRPEYGDERDPEMRAHLENISPLNNVDRIQVPLFVVQGQNDPRVPVTEAEQVVAALREQGGEVWYMNALDEGHGYRKKANRDVYQQATVLFFEQFLTADKD